MADLLENLLLTLDSGIYKTSNQCGLEKPNPGPQGGWHCFVQEWTNIQAWSFCSQDHTTSQEEKWWHIWCHHRVQTWDRRSNHISQPSSSQHLPLHGCRDHRSRGSGHRVAARWCSRHHCSRVVSKRCSGRNRQWLKGFQILYIGEISLLIAWSSPFIYLWNYFSILQFQTFLSLLLLLISVSKSYLFIHIKGEESHYQANQSIKRSNPWIINYFIL